MNNAQIHGCQLEGWVCFHCGELFTAVGGAADHFGATPDRTPACQIKLGEERGLVMELRRAEAREQALAANLEALREAYTAFVDTGFDELLENAFESTPETPIARRDAEKQAEILERFGDKWDWEERAPSHKDFRVAAMAIRRQADTAGEAKTQE